MIRKVADGNAASSPGIVQEIFSARFQAIPKNEILGRSRLDLSQPVNVVGRFRFHVHETEDRRRNMGDDVAAVDVARDLNSLQGLHEISIADSRRS